MDPSTAVVTSPLLALLAFLGVIILLLFLIAKWRWHVFLALLVPLLIFGVIPGVERNNFIDAFKISKVDGACTNNIYHYSEKSIKLIKETLKKKGVYVRTE